MAWPVGSRSEAWRVGDVVADLYDVRAVINTGGMGLVYRVWHRAWAVELAVKVPRVGLVGTAAQLRRFEEEAEAWVALGAHPNTVVCRYVRQLDGVPCVFAEWVDGGDLAEAVRSRLLYDRGEHDDQALTVGHLLDVVIQFAWGLEHAHARGFVHQDVKPSNAMLTRGGAVKVTDFGLAKSFARSTGSGVPDASGRVRYAGAMTRPYCSPEQARAAVEPATRLSAATDVWSWAISVWELFAGEPPCAFGQTAGETFPLFLAEANVVPGIPAMPAAVATLLSRCFVLEPDARPGMAELAGELVGLYEGLAGRSYTRPRPLAGEQTAGELSNHALSLLDVGQPARAEELWERARTADPRNPYVVYNHGLRRWRQARTTDAELIAELNAAHGGGPVGDHLLGLVHRERGDVAAARWHLERAARVISDDPDLAGALATVRDLPVDPPPVVLGGHCDAVRSVSVSADGRLAASGSDDRTIRVWDVGSASCRHILAMPGPVGAMAMSQDASRLVAHDGWDALLVWDVGSGRLRQRLAAGATSKHRGSRGEIASARLPRNQHQPPCRRATGRRVSGRRPPRRSRPRRKRPAMCRTDGNHQPVRWYLRVPSSCSTRLIVLALTPCCSANSINVDPARYAAASMRRSTLARPTTGGALCSDVTGPDAPMASAGCEWVSSSVLSSAFVWFTWYE